MDIQISLGFVVVSVVVIVLVTLWIGKHLFGSEAAHPMKPLNQLSKSEIEILRKESETLAVIGGTILGPEFVPPEYKLIELASVINDQTLGLRKFPPAIRVIYCILWHLNRRLEILEAPKKE